jgi:hypothetical protein
VTTARSAGANRKRNHRDPPLNSCGKQSAGRKNARKKRMRTQMAFKCVFFQKRNLFYIIIGLAVAIVTPCFILCPRLLPLY